jgi:hypothetical protein
MIVLIRCTDGAVVNLGLTSRLFVRTEVQVPDEREGAHADREPGDPHPTVPKTVDQLIAHVTPGGFAPLTGHEGGTAALEFLLEDLEALTHRVSGEAVVPAVRVVEVRTAARATPQGWQ